MYSGFYQSSAFGRSSSSSASSAPTSSSGTAQTTLASAQIGGSTPSTAGFASFVCHVAYLEDRLRRGDQSKFFDGHEIQAATRVPAGEGGFFTVDRARLEDSSVAGGRAFVAIKIAKDQSGHPSRWKDILLEVRALLHEPLRYHPNIVHLLDIGWIASSDTGSPFPTFVLEFADFGTFDSLQLRNRSSLPFRIKQKLCYDVGRGLSILHACGIIHGDLKHENVLIFRNRHEYPPDQPYTAKLADFGGAVMNIGTERSHLLRMATVPYDAPELGQELTAEGIKATDAYSYGMLVWRAFIDCQDLLIAINFRQAAVSLSDDELSRLKQLKQSDSFLRMAVESLQTYGQARSLPEDSIQMVTYTVNSTLRANPASRSLVQAQARLRGMSTAKVEDYIMALKGENVRQIERERSRVPGSHGIDVDSLGYALGRMGETYDAQQNLPGCRPDLPHPALGGFLFEPFKLKEILDWSQQVAMVRELERLANLPPFDESSAETQPWVASYHLFQACLTGFGTDIDLEKACHWLHKTSKAEIESADVDYLAKAWLSRICNAVGVASPLTPDEQIEDLFWSIIRGHRHCVEDSEFVIPLFSDSEKATAARARINKAVWLNIALTGATGMPHYVPRNMSRAYDLSDLQSLDADIRLELGDEYELCLRSASESLTAPPPEGKYRFDKIYVNQRGHGLLHYAATSGNLAALSHLFRKYRCNINLPNQSLSETALVCACRAGQFDCAIFCLDNGADPNGSQFGEEGPLHWISSFKEDRMRVITQKLVEAGADVSKTCRGMRKDVRRIFADWEDRLGLSLTPLGRAVLMKSLPAVKALLDASANPHERSSWEGKMNLSAIQLAAVLTLPDILQELLDHQDARDGKCQLEVFDEWEMLTTAHGMPGQGAADPLTLHSRLVRCGFKYKDWLAHTVRILHDRRSRQQANSDNSSASGMRRATCLCREVQLGNMDIVQALLELGNDANGLPGHRPLAAAVESNNMDMFQLVLFHGAELTFGNDEETLMQAFASRPRTVPEELEIAQFLIDNGVPVESAHGARPSPLASAVRNGYFSLADLLIANGAGDSVNHFYQWDSSGNLLTVLGVLLQSQTFSSLLAVNYLATKHKEQTLVLQPLVDTSRDLSPVHILALEDPARMNSRQQISPRIIHHVLDIFPTSDTLKEHAIHDEYGTAFTAAVLSVNADVVSALLESDYQSDVHTTVKLRSIPSKFGVSDGVSPSTLVLIQFLQRVEIFQRQGFLNHDEFEEMKRLERLGLTLLDAASKIQQPQPDQGSTPLSQSNPGAALQGMQGLYGLMMAKMEDLERRTAVQTAMSSLSLGSAESSALSSAQAKGDDEMPVSLAQVTKDKQKNWWDTRDEGE